MIQEGGFFKWVAGSPGYTGSVEHTISNDSFDIQTPKWSYKILYTMILWFLKMSVEKNHNKYIHSIKTSQIHLRQKNLCNSILRSFETSPQKKFAWLEEQILFGHYISVQLLVNLSPPTISSGCSMNPLKSRGNLKWVKLEKFYPELN